MGRSGRWDMAQGLSNLHQCCALLWDSGWPKVGARWHTHHEVEPLNMCYGFIAAHDVHPEESYCNPSLAKSTISTMHLAVCFC